MKAIAPLVAAAILSLGLASTAGAQIPTPPVPDSVKSIQDSAQKVLILSDAIAAREMLAQERRAMELADLGAKNAVSNEIRDFALTLQKQHAKRFIDLTTIIEKLELNQRQLGLGSGVARDTVAGFVAFYWEDTVAVFTRDTSGNYVRDTGRVFRREKSSAAAMSKAPKSTVDSMGTYTQDQAMLFRRNSDGTYSSERVPVFRLAKMEVVPVPEPVQAIIVDSAEIMSRHIAALENLRSLSGQEFEKAWLDREIEADKWRAARLRNTIIPLLTNDELKDIAADMLAEVGGALQKAEGLRASIN